MVSVTRSQTGKTPKYVFNPPAAPSAQGLHVCLLPFPLTSTCRKPDNFPGLIDTSAISKPRFRNTPGNSRKSTPALGDDSLRVKGEELTEEEKLFGAKSSKALAETADNRVKMAEQKANGKDASFVVNTKSNVTDVAVEKKDGAKVVNYKIDDSGVKEFGGSLGTFFAMFFFPFLMWYLWIGQVHYNAQLPLPEKGESITHFWWKMVGYVMEVCTEFILYHLGH